MAKRRHKVYQYLPHILLPKRKLPRYDPATIPEQRNQEIDTVYTLFNYDASELSEFQSKQQVDWAPITSAHQNTWINVDGLRKDEVESLTAYFKIHPLLTEDILSIGQRAKMDEVDGLLFCLLPMIYFNKESKCIELEQVSIVVGNGFLLSFQEDATRDVFDPLRSRLRNGSQRVREKGIDFLCYSMLDVIVDSYFSIIEQLSDHIETIEEMLLNHQEQGLLKDISHIRKEVMILKRAIAPVRELISGFLRTENPLIEDRNTKYFKDIHDHIIQAHDNCESLRDMLSNLQDLYMNQINLRMNEVMKIFTMVSLLLAPATVIGGIFGMNFERIPLLHDQRGFYFSVAAMLLIPISMMIYFKKKKWF
jgi:magnesium transporter